MKEFVYGNKAQFLALDRELSNGRKYKFPGRKMPDSCIPSVACIWFAKNDGQYQIYIDKGISTNSDHQGFTNLLERGNLVFDSIDDMISYFYSLRPLFDTVRSYRTNQEKSNNEDKDGVDEAEEICEPVVDKQELRRIRKEQQTSASVWPEKIASELKKVIFGQDEVMDSLANKIVISRLRSEKMILSIGLLGPTGTGKSETGKSLAKILSKVYGVKFGFIDIKANQMVGEHSVHSFFGAPPGYIGHGSPTLLEPVRKNPNHVIVIEEVEKAHQTVLTGLMEAIDTGILDMADNSEAIDLNSCILLFTSNIPIDMKEYRSASEFSRGEICRDAFTRHCNRPEISGKIGNFLVYDNLSEDAIADIITKFIKDELKGYRLRLKSIDPHLMSDFISHETKYGARPLRILVSDAIGKQLLTNHKVKSMAEKCVSLSGTIQCIHFEIV